MDTVTPEVRSRIMGRIRGKNTKPELMLRRALHAEGVRFRVHDRTVPGTPDITHKGRRIAVFVDGCFWHGCPKHYSRPRSRQEFWDRKLAYNRDLRQRVRARLDGWTVVEHWECEVRGRTDTGTRPGEAVATPGLVES
ncbi:MAG TPA: very short patch repair endonuclease [Candidatus Thermoplasmatota archaeon]|nr:very short patch repair endonuclease [Candidatus Thermoplasmatota archaeon]